jgi:transcriptional regulator with XRE-family HTH domain
MKERIIRIMKEKNMNASQFSDAIGIQRATISHILAGRNNPSLDMVMKILAKFPEISPDWLLSGKEPITRSLPENTGNNNITGISGRPVMSGDLFSQPDIPLMENPEMKERLKRTENLVRTPVVTGKNENPAANIHTTGIHTKTAFTNGKNPAGDVYKDKTGEEMLKETIVYKERSRKTIDKLLIFYSDNTFESFIPEKHHE